VAFLPPSPCPVPCQVFLSIKGIYYQAEVLGQPVTWITPYAFAHDVSTWAEHGRTRAGRVRRRSCCAAGRGRGGDHVGRRGQHAGTQPPSIPRGGCTCVPGAWLYQSP